MTAAPVAGCLMVLALNASRIGELLTDMSEGARNAVPPIFNTASEVGFGATSPPAGVLQAHRPEDEEQ